MANAGPDDGRHTTVLVLQGGGALGAYQGGAFEAMADTAWQPDWVAGISIGAINAALIAGNPPERRRARLKTFWEQVTFGDPAAPWRAAAGPLRALANEWAAGWAMAFGLPGFFLPRTGFTGPFGAWVGDRSKPSLYDTEPLRRTLVDLIDFDLINDGPMRLSVGVVDVASGNFDYFDNRRQPIGPEHIMASGALPPGFPAVTVDGRAYWDGGLVSNTPLRHVVETLDSPAATIFQIDLFPARGKVPTTLAEVAEREKDIRFSSRTRAVTDMLRERHELHRRIRELGARLKPGEREDPELRQWIADAAEASVDLVHLIRRHQQWESQNKDYEFSRTSMLEHWRAGHADMTHSLHRLESVAHQRTTGGFRVFDLSDGHPASTDPRPQGE
ncbi:MAG: patatin-like phospholipase family protein [Lautropia sp.]